MRSGRGDDIGATTFPIRDLRRNTALRLLGRALRQPVHHSTGDSGRGDQSHLQQQGTALLLLIRSNGLARRTRCRAAHRRHSFCRRRAQWLLHLLLQCLAAGPEWRAALRLSSPACRRSILRRAHSACGTGCSGPLRGIDGGAVLLSAGAAERALLLRLCAFRAAAQHHGQQSAPCNLRKYLLMSFHSAALLDKNFLLRALNFELRHAFCGSPPE